MSSIIEHCRESADGGGGDGGGCLAKAMVSIFSASLVVAVFFANAAIDFIGLIFFTFGILGDFVVLHFLCKSF